MDGTNVQSGAAGPVELLAQRLPTLSAELRKAAAWIVDHPDEAALMSLRAIAKSASVHPNSVTRLTREMGFESFSAFRAPLRDSLKSTTHSFPDRAAWLQNVSQRHEQGELFASLARSAASNVEQTFLTTTPAAFEAAAKDIHASRTTYVLGVGMAQAFAENFAYLADMAVDKVHAIPQLGSHPTDSLARAGQGDVLIAMTFKPYRTEVVQAVEQAVEQGVKIIAISDSRAAPHFQHAAHQFTLPTDTPQFFTSTVALAAFLETLMAFVIASADPSAVASIERLDERRHALGIYWEEE